jgi:hypothetical protein
VGSAGKMCLRPTKKQMIMKTARETEEICSFRLIGEDITLSM